MGPSLSNGITRAEVGAEPPGHVVEALDLLFRVRGTLRFSAKVFVEGRPSGLRVNLDACGFGIERDVVDGKPEAAVFLGAAALWRCGVSAKKAASARRAKAGARVRKLIAKLAKTPGGLEALERVCNRLLVHFAEVLKKELRRT